MIDGTPREYYTVTILLSGLPGDHLVPYVLVPCTNLDSLGAGDLVESTVHGDTERSFLSAATGVTTRLANSCLACGDTYPQGAAFCVSCGAER